MTDLLAGRRDNEVPSRLIQKSSARVRAFEIGRQEALERARLRRLQPILETVAHRIGSTLTSTIRQPVHFEFSGFEQMAWEQHATTLPDPTFVSSAVLLPLDGRLVMHIPVLLVLDLLDYYLGGDAQNQPDRDQLTDIERTLVGTITELIWNEIPPPFATVMALNIALLQNSTSATLLQVGRPGVTCLIVDFAVTAGDRPTQTIQLSIPHTVLVPVVEHLEHQSGAEGIPGGGDRRETRRRLLSVPVDVKVSYPPIDLTPDELLSLQVGDVIGLEQEVTSGPTELRLMVQDTLYGTGVLIENGNKLTCTVVTKKEPEHD